METIKKDMLLLHVLTIRSLTELNGRKDSPTLKIWDKGFVIVVISFITNIKLLWPRT